MGLSIHLQRLKGQGQVGSNREMSGLGQRKTYIGQLDIYKAKWTATVIAGGVEPRQLKGRGQEDTYRKLRGGARCSAKEN